MKILDYFTIASLTGAKVSMELNKFAVDINSDVVPIERGSVIVVSESKKLGNNKQEKFSMYLVSQTSSRYIQGFETLKEVQEAYARLFSSRVFNLDTSSSSICKKVEDVVNYNELERN